VSPLGLQLAALGATLAIELPLAAALAPRDARAAFLRAALCANLASHAGATLTAWIAAPPWIALELAVVAFEACALRVATGSTLERAAIVAVVANAASAAFALAVQP
jgi:hypothetical protein